MRVGSGCSPCLMGLRGAAGGNLSPLYDGLQALWYGGGLNFEAPQYALTNTGGVDFATTNNLFGGGKCALFSGANYLTISNANGPLLSVATPNPLTFMALFRIADNGAFINLIGKGSEANTYEYALAYVNGSGVFGYLGNGTSGTLTPVGDYGGGGTTGNIANNEWYLGFLSYDPAAGAGGTTYIRGAKVATQAALNTKLGVPNISGVSRGVGSGGFGLWRYAGATTVKAGNCGAFGLWSRLLTAAEELSILTNIRAGFAPF